MFHIFQLRPLFGCLRQLIFRLVHLSLVHHRGGFVTLRFKDSSGGMRVRESRLYKTKEEAEKVANSNKKK